MNIYSKFLKIDVPVLASNHLMFTRFWKTLFIGVASSDFSRWQFTKSVFWFILTGIRTPGRLRIEYADALRVACTTNIKVNNAACPTTFSDTSKFFLSY